MCVFVCKRLRRSRDIEHDQLEHHSDGDRHDGLEIEIKRPKEGDEEAYAQLMRLVHVCDGLHLVYEHLHLE
jgi:hypothetical protein